MSGIFDIPDSLLNDIFATWISETDLCRLDLAVCNHALRPVILHQLRTMSPIRVKMFVKPLRHLRMYVWLHIRGVRLKNLDIDEVLLDSWFDELLACDLSSVESIHFENRYGNNDYDAMLSTLVNSCPALKGLSVTGNTYGGFRLSPVVFEQVRADVWSALQFLSFYDCLDESMFVSLGMCDRLGQLRTLSVDGSGNLTELTGIVRSNPLLANVRLSGYFSSFHSLLGALVITSRRMEALSIAAENEHLDYRMSDIAQLFRSNPGLTYFDLTNANSGLTLSAQRASLRYYPDRTDFGDVIPLVRGKQSLLLDELPLTDAQLLALAAQNGATLESLHMFDCDGVSAVALKKCLQTCSRVSQLKIAVDGYSSEEWKEVLRGPQSLKILQLKNRVQHDQRMTCDVYVSILLANPSVQYLFGCPEAVVDPVRAWCLSQQRKVTVSSQ